MDLVCGGRSFLPWHVVVCAGNVKLLVPPCSRFGGWFGFRSSGDDFGVYYVFQVFSVVFWWWWWFFWWRQIWWHNGCFLADFDGVVVVVDFPATIDLDGCLRVEMVR
jgi:hypothetical protein